MNEPQHIVAADWGGTNCRSIVATIEDGKLPELLEATFRRTESGGDDLQKLLERGIGETINGFRGKIAGVGLAVAGPIDEHATVINAPNIPELRWRVPFNLRRYLEQQFGVRSLAANDLESAADGEIQRGALQGIDWAMLENIGTGWGGTYIYDGVAVAAEPGHIWLPGEGEPCGCGKRDCAEARYSGGAIERRILQICDARGIAVPDRENVGPFADQEVLKGTPWAVELYAEIADAIGKVWGSRLNVCPRFTDLLYMGSFIENAMRIQSFRDGVIKAMRGQSMFPSHEKINPREVQAPRLQNGESGGPLWGVARIWQREYVKAA